MKVLAELKAELLKRVMLLDGPTGTALQRFSLEEEDFRGKRFADYAHSVKGNNDLLNLTQPELVRTILAEYLEAGADFLQTNTFSSTTIAQADYSFDAGIVAELNLSGAKISRDLVDEFNRKDPTKKRYVYGVLGPTNRTATISPQVNDPAFRNVTYDQLVTAYYDQARVLLDNGVDLLMIETVFDTLNCKAAVFAHSQLCLDLEQEIPLMISGTITDASGRTLTGQTAEAFYTSVAHADHLLSIGLNCALGAAELKTYLREISDVCTVFTSAHPNAGLPNELGEYDQSAAQFAREIADYLDDGLVNIIGGCCGTTPLHIKAVSELIVQQQSVRQPARLSSGLKLAGLEAVTINQLSNFVNVGERTNVTGSAKFRKLVKAQKTEAAIGVALEQVENGAQILDINFDEGLLDSEQEMETFLRLISAEPDITKIPVMIDSSRWSVLEAGLKNVQGKPVVNSISLKDGEAAFIQRARLIKRYGAAVVVMAFDEDGQADTFDRKTAVCARAYKLITEQAGFPPQDIIFDPNILTVGTGIAEHNNYANDFIAAVKWIKANLPGVKTSGGLSNISFSFRGNNQVREAMHSAFLYHAIASGLDMAIVNAGILPVYEDIPEELLVAVEDVLLNRNKEATENLIELAPRYSGKGKQLQKDTADWKLLEPEARITAALIKGDDSQIVADVELARADYPNTLGLIEGPLMAGMNEVGDLFGAGKMFLPQVVKSARVMKKAVNYLIPFLEAESEGAVKSSAGKVLLATVKGDVHDIGKNIVSVVLACNNYDIVDLGVMVPHEKILKAAKAEQVDVIGLSGLITPSLDEMVYFCKLLEKDPDLNGTPVLIGGATTSLKHTAIKIDPHYSGSVTHVKDASKAVPVLSKLLSKTPNTLVADTKARYQKVREDYAAAKQTYRFSSLESARQNRYQIDWANYQPATPLKTGVHTLDNIQINELVSYIDWSPFFNTWDLKGRYPDILNSPRYGKQARELRADAIAMLKLMEAQNVPKAKAVYGIFPANTVENCDDVAVFNPESPADQIATLHSLRQQQEKTTGQSNYALADYIAPLNAGYQDYIGAFAVTTGIDLELLITRFKSEQDDYSVIMAQAIADRLAEALTEYLHFKVRTEYWGYSDLSLTNQQMIKEQYHGIRPAAGYPACPDHTEKETIFALLQAGLHTGITLTEHYAMLPAASVSGLYFAHPQARYFGLGRITEEQVRDYARRKHIDFDTMSTWLQSNVA